MGRAITVVLITLGTCADDGLSKLEGLLSSATGRSRPSSGNATRDR